MKYLLSTITLVVFQVLGQSEICGKVFVDKVSQEGVKVFILNSTDTVLTNKNGKFCLVNNRDIYKVQAEFIGFKSDTVIISQEKKETNIYIQTPYLFESVDIVSKNIADTKKEHSIKINIINLETQKQSSTSVEQLMNQSSGIRIRNNGGIGAESDIVMGGFHGRSIKFLLDGIPLDYLGSSMGLTKFPTNMANHIEIYKGVLPTEIGADALGGAVNIVTKIPAKTKHQFSYEAGSFNSHRITLNSFIKKYKRISFGINAYASHSDNNFKVENLPCENEKTGKTEIISATLFHNGYQQISGDIFVNLTDRKWADLFKITLNSYGLQRQIQNDFSSRDKPYGGVVRKENAYIIPSLQFKKYLLDNKLNISQFVVFSHINYQLIDSVKNAYYDWLGNRHETISGSEMGNDLSNLKEPIIKASVSNFTYRGLFNYQIRKSQKLTLNIVENYLSRIADNLGKYNTQEMIFYNRLIVSSGYSYQFWDEKIEGLTQVKYLGAQTNSRSVSDYSNAENITKPVRQNGWSFAQSLKFNGKNGLLIRTSVENTYRLADQLELFGDNVFIIPNLHLKPERSLNYNLGAGYTKINKIYLEVNLYYRKTKDMVRLKEITQFQSMFLNLDNVTGYGIELEAAFFPIENLEISGNLTYNEFRFKGSNNNFSNNTHFINARVSNLPFYFSNAKASYQFNKVFNKEDQLKIYWNYTYVHQYYLDFIEKQYEPEGFLGLFGKSKIYTERVIPVQQINTVGFVWSSELSKKKNTFSFALELHNVFNYPVYNYFKMQGAGRSIMMKLSYEI